MIYLYLYILFSLIVSCVYVYLYSKHFMSKDVKKASKAEKLRVYVMFFCVMFAVAPYALYEIIATYNKGGFTK